MITLFFPITPVVKKRPRLGKWGAYTPAITRNFERAIAAIAKNAMNGQRPIAGAVKLTARFIFKPAKKPSRPYPSRGDLSNYIKALEDGMNGIVWVDDVQVVRSECEKFYDVSGGESRILVTVEEIEDV